MGCATPDATVGVAYEVTCTVTGFPPPELMFLGVGGDPWPSWLSFNDQTLNGGPLVLSGTPEANDVGEHGIEINANNSEGVHQFVGFITVAP